MYQLGQPQIVKKRHPKRWVAIIVCLIGVAAGGWWFAHTHLKTNTSITQSAPVTTRVTSTNGSTQHYDKGDFGVDLPSSWQPIGRPPGPYHTFAWESTGTAQNETGNQVITVYEDTIPANYAVNRAVIVQAETDHIIPQGTASDNCATFTQNIAPKANQISVPAKWQGVDFLCDQGTTQRDNLGTSSTDGINTVVLKSLGSGRTHKYFFTYTDYQINPDYSVFYNFLNSFHTV